MCAPNTELEKEKTCDCVTIAKDDNIFLPKEVEVVSIKQMTATESHLTLKMKNNESMDYQPGQIVEAGLFGYGEIPLGFSSSPTQTLKTGIFELVVRQVGKVSTALCALKAGDTLTIRGPLGNGFPVDEFKGQDVLIIAGGIGLCPTRSMIRYILDKREDFNRFILFFGTKTPADQLFTEDLEDWRLADGIEYLETVDKGNDKWKGKVGVITTLFEDVKDLKPATKVIICGPPIMYKFVIAELKKFNIPEENIYVDLERRMKCGVGKCGHCQINDKYVCIDGPVFKFSEIKDLEEAI
ncbi:MAG: FAD/NAD(P)-binding protein [Candidatus Omnitrophica bacterium]|nr:FAD/NAD(P)-binding protein [Candidatus Omnitrophota bacterium]